jgi:PPOX class probable F420-dependent enzyme
VTAKRIAASLEVEPMQSHAQAPSQTFQPFVHQGTILLRTFRRDGTPVGTPVHIVVEDDHAYVRTWDTAGKLKRLRNNPRVELAPSTIRGTPTGPFISAHVRILAGEESAHAGRLLARKYPFLHGFLIPLVHRLRGNTTMHIELRPLDG